MPKQITKVQWSASNVPYGVDFNNTTGTFTGTPEDEGEYTVPVSVTTNYGTATENVKININGAVDLTYPRIIAQYKKYPSNDVEYGYFYYYDKRTKIIRQPLEQGNVAHKLRWFNDDLQINGTWTAFYIENLSELNNFPTEKHLISDAEWGLGCYMDGGFKKDFYDISLQKVDSTFINLKVGNLSPLIQFENNSGSTVKILSLKDDFSDCISAINNYINENSIDVSTLTKLAAVYGYLSIKSDLLGIPFCHNMMEYTKSFEYE